MFGQAMNPIIRADGSPRFAMVSTLVGAIANTILDPIFLFVFRWGMMGAAVATVIGQVLTAALSVWYLLHRKTIRLGKKDFALQGSVSGGTLGLGITSFLSQISLVAAMAAINNMLQVYGARDAVFGQAQYAQIPMAVVGIVMKFFQIVISIVVGMAAGCIPIVGFNMGAGKRDRVRALFTKLLVGEAAVGIVALVLAERFPRNLISLFGAANESRYYTEFAVLAFRTYLCMLPLACVNKACFIFLQAGQGGRVHGPVHDPRGRLRRGIRAAAPGVLRAQRRAVLHARLRRADVPRGGLPDRAHLPPAAQRSRARVRRGHSLDAARKIR